jgi:hypothetical protein
VLYLWLVLEYTNKLPIFWSSGLNQNRLASCILIIRANVCLICVYQQTSYILITRAKSKQAS